MKYLSKEPIVCTPPTKEYEESWERVFGKKSFEMVVAKVPHCEDSHCYSCNKFLC